MLRVKTNARAIELSFAFIKEVALYTPLDAAGNQLFWAEN